METFIKKFQNITINDIPEVGGKNASLGEMFSRLHTGGILVPNGFATTADAFWYFLNENNLRRPLEQLLATLNRQTYANLKKIGAGARQLMMQAKIPDAISASILNEYRELCNNEPVSVAVRSSATAEDLPQASFAGQHESFLNIRNERDAPAAG